MKDYYLNRFMCFFLSLVFMFSAVFSVCGIMGIGFFRSQDFIKSRLCVYEDELIEQINCKIGDVFENEDIPKEAFIGALDNENAEKICDIVANNFVLCTKTDMSQNMELYNTFYKYAENYCAENGINASNTKISHASSLAVDTVSQILFETNSNGIKVFSLAQNNFSIIVCAFFAAAAVASFVLLDLVNKGRHRKFSYMGMGLCGAGYIFIIVTAFIFNMGYAENFEFCKSAIFNRAISDTIEYVLRFNYLFGALFIVAGILMLCLNYRYFSKKNVRVTQERELNSKLRNEYLEHYNRKKGIKNHENELGKRDVAEIDFE